MPTHLLTAAKFLCLRSLTVIHASLLPPAQGSTKAGGKDEVALTPSSDLRFCRPEPVSVFS